MKCFGLQEDCGYFSIREAVCFSMGPKSTSSRLARIPDFPLRARAPLDHPARKPQRWCRLGLSSEVDESRKRRRTMILKPGKAMDWTGREVCCEGCVRRGAGERE